MIQIPKITKLCVNTFNTEYEVVVTATKNMGFKEKKLEVLFFAS